MSAFIVVLGGIFLAIAVAAVYILVQKKVISNPLDYISSMFSPGGVGETGGLGGLGETGETGGTGGTDEIYGTDETGGTYVDKFSPNKKVKGRYVWITRANANSTAYRNALKGYYDMWAIDTYHERAPISATEITVTGKDGETLTEKTPPYTAEELEGTTETRYDDRNYVLVEDLCGYDECYGSQWYLQVVWDGNIIQDCEDCGTDAQAPYSKGDLQSGSTLGVGGARYKIIKTTKPTQRTPAEQAAKVDVYDQSGALSLNESDLLFNNDIDNEGNDKKDRFTSRGSTSTVDYIKIDLRSIKTISGIRLDSLYEKDEDMYWNYNLLGVYVVVTREDNMDRPVAITPIIKKLGTSHSFEFPGTEWSSDSHDDLKLKFL